MLSVSLLTRWVLVEEKKYSARRRSLYGETIIQFIISQEL